MNVSLYQAAAALGANSRWQELVAENITSSSISGYKKQALSFEAVRGGLLPPTSANPLGGSQAGMPQHFALPKATTMTNFSAGMMRPTGNDTDLAIEGPGFFEVQLPNGDLAYTRSGEFQINSQGQLVTKSGFLVLTDSGPIQFDLNNPDKLSVAPSGEISKGKDLLGQLRLMEFKDPSQLTQIAGGYFVPRSPFVRAQPSTTSTVAQGLVESSNASPVTEMVELITSMRAFEANQKIIQLTDDRMGRTIQDLGNPA